MGEAIEEIRLFDEQFEGFTVYSSDDKFSFLYANFNDERAFIEGLVSYIFREENLLLYSKLSSKIMINPGAREYARVYKNLEYFLNAEIEKIPIVNLDYNLEQILNEEYECFKDTNGNFIIQSDKIGKIGEYIFHLLLTRYFGYECIIPKIYMTTNRNMSVFGIDTLFYDEKNREILFGEAKFSNKLDSGINLINRSLGSYEESIKEEYLLVLSNEFYNLNKTFANNYQKTIDMCSTFEEFAEKANLSSVVIPIFIAHGDGKAVELEEIFKKFKKIICNDILGLKTKYLFISLPVTDKTKFVNYTIAKVREKADEYKSYFEKGTRI